MILVCGPPGAGKTTQARRLATQHHPNLTVYDLDDTRWAGESVFRDAIARLGQDPEARAVVIRSGARRRHRARWSRLVKATEVLTLTVDPMTCKQRIKQRNRPRPPLAQQLAAVDRWWADHEPDRIDPGRHARVWARPSER